MGLDDTFRGQRQGERGLRAASVESRLLGPTSGASRLLGALTPAIQQSV